MCSLSKGGVSRNILTFYTVFHCCAFSLMFLVVTLVENSKTASLPSLSFIQTSYPPRHQPTWGQGSANKVKVSFRNFFWCFHCCLPAQRGSPWWSWWFSWAGPGSMSDHSCPTAPPGSSGSLPAALPLLTRAPTVRGDGFISNLPCLWILAGGCKSNINDPISPADQTMMLKRKSV